MGEIVTGTTPSTKIKEYYSNGKYLWVTPTDICGKEITTTNQKLTELGLKKGRKIQKNSILVTCVASIGKNCILREAGSCNQQINAIAVNNIHNIDFVYYLMENSVSMLHKYSSKGGMEILNKDVFSNLIVYTPNIEEQSKIANFLSLIDKIIELQNKIIKDYKLLKKELNNKLFCQINNSTPKIRFKNFYEKWAKNKVKNIFESVTRGCALSKKDISTIKTNTFKYPVYSSQTLNNGLLGYYSNYLYENAITWTTDGANAGEVNFRKDKFYCTNVCGVLLSNNGYCNECMAAIINKVTKKFVSLVGNPKLMNNVMENIEIIFPSNIKEQLKISIFLSTIDKIIALYKNAINLYKKQKNFFLSKLFI